MFASARDVNSVALIYIAKRVSFNINVAPQVLSLITRAQITAEQPEARLDLLTKSSEGKHPPWSRSIFKEIGEGAGSSYFMYILVR